MAEVIVINRETPLEFVRRNGPTCTSEVAYRFNMDMRQARKTMKDLEASGEVNSRRVSHPLGAELEWRANQQRGKSTDGTS